MVYLEPGMLVKSDKGATGVVITADATNDRISVGFYNREKETLTVVEGLSIKSLCRYPSGKLLSYNHPTFDPAWLLSGAKIGVFIALGILALTKFF